MQEVYYSFVASVTLYRLDHRPKTTPHSKNSMPLRLISIRRIEGMSSLQPM